MSDVMKNYKIKILLDGYENTKTRGKEMERGHKISKVQWIL